MSPDQPHDPLAEAVVATLQHVADDLPVAVPAWDGVRAGMRRARRRRRLRIAGRTGGIVLAVACVLGGVQFGLVPYPSWAPAVTVPGRPASRLAHQPTKGSLAGDAAWLKALRTRATRFSQDDGSAQVWRIASADDVTVIFAGDVGAYRLALVEAPVRAGLLRSGMQIWFAGPRGCGPAAMEPGATSEPLDATFQVFQQLPRAASEQTVPTTVVVAADQSAVEIAGPPTIGGDGQVRWPVTRLTALEQGLWADVPSGSPITGERYVRIGGGPWQTTYSGWAGDRYDPMALVDAALPALHPGGTPPDRNDLEMNLSLLLARFGLVRPDGSTPGVSTRLLWHGPMAGRTTIVVAVTLPGGARVIETVAKEPLNDGYGGYVQRGSEFVAGPGPLDDLGVAFALTSVGFKGDYPPVASIGLVGPRAATSAVVVDARGGRHEVALADGIGNSTVTDAVRVEFRGPTGRTLTTARVAGIGAQLPGPPG